MLFESVSIEAAEGESGVEVCLRLGGTDWLVLERHLIFELESDGGILIWSSVGKSPCPVLYYLYLRDECGSLTDWKCDLFGW